MILLCVLGKVPGTTSTVAGSERRQSVGGPPGVGEEESEADGVLAKDGGG